MNCLFHRWECVCVSSKDINFSGEYCIMRETTQKCSKCGKTKKSVSIVELRNMFNPQKEICILEK